MVVTYISLAMELGEILDIPGELEKESVECFLLTSFLVAQTVPDCRKSRHRPLAGPFSKS